MLSPPLEMKTYRNIENKEMILVVFLLIGKKIFENLYIMNISGSNQFWKAIKLIFRSSKYDKIALNNSNNSILAEKLDITFVSFVNSLNITLVKIF